jgi:two-component system, chemotaxis family, chemotaxis protein CheY
MGYGQEVAATVLIVDDSPTVRLHLRSLLEEHGFQVEEAGNGLEGLEAARQTRYQVIIADVNMPIMNGLDMIAGIRQLDAHRDTPIFVATTEVSDDMVQEGAARGASGWIVKPLDAEVLIPAIRRALR